MPQNAILPNKPEVLSMGNTLLPSRELAPHCPKWPQTALRGTKQSTACPSQRLQGIFPFCSKTGGRRTWLRGAAWTQGRVSGKREQPHIPCTWWHFARGSQTPAAWVVHLNWAVCLVKNQAVNELNLAMPSLLMMLPSRKGSLKLQPFLFVLLNAKQQDLFWSQLFSELNLPFLAICAAAHIYAYKQQKVSIFVVSLTTRVPVAISAADIEPLSTATTEEEQNLMLQPTCALVHETPWDQLWLDPSGRRGSEGAKST